MMRNQVYKKRRNPLKRTSRNMSRFNNCANQMKTITYMEELGRLGHWLYDFNNNAVEMSDGAIKIFRDELGEKKQRFEQSTLNKFDVTSKQKLYAMTQVARKTGKSMTEEVHKLNDDGSISRLRMLLGMADKSVLVGIVQDMTPWYDREKNIRDQLKMTQDIIDAIPIPVFMKDQTGEFKHCNKALIEMLGINKENFIGKSAYEIGDPLNAEMYVDTDAELIQNGGVIQYETIVKRHVYEPKHCVITKTILKDTSQRTTGIVGTLRDITEDKKKSNHIDKLLKLKDAMMEITHAIMDNRSETELFHLILDKGLEVIDRADHGTVLMRGGDGLFRPVAWRGFSDQEISGFELELESSFVWRATKGAMTKSVRINNLSELLVEDIPDLAESKSGMLIHASLCSPIIVEGEIIGLMNLDSTIVDAFDESDLSLSDYMREQLEIALTRRKLYDKVVFLSRHDELTGLYNRRFFEELAENTLKRSNRYNENFCLTVFDLNGLKEINDNYGHQIGDAVIKKFAEILQDSFRETDLLGRYGGDEFVGIFHEGDREFLHNRLEEVLSRLKNSPVLHEDNEVVCSFSYGIASYPEEGDSYNKLVSVADSSMYDYKKALKKNKAKR